MIDNGAKTVEESVGGSASSHRHDSVKALGFQSEAVPLGGVVSQFFRVGF